MLNMSTTACIGGTDFLLSNPVYEAATQELATFARKSTLCPGAVNTGETKETGILIWKKVVPIYNCGLEEDNNS